MTISICSVALLSGPINPGREMSVPVLQASTTGNGWHGSMGAGHLSSLRWDWAVHTSPVTPLWVLLVWVTCKYMLVNMTGYADCKAMRNRCFSLYDCAVKAFVQVKAATLWTGQEKQITQRQCLTWNYSNIHHQTGITSTVYMRQVNAN